MQRNQDAKDIIMTDSNSDAELRILLAENKSLHEENQMLKEQIKQLFQRAGISLPAGSVTSAGSPPGSSVTLFQPVSRAEQLQIQLVKACKQGEYKTVQDLLDAGAKPGVPTSSGELSYYAAVFGGNPEVLNLLLSKSEAGEQITWEECEAHSKKQLYPKIINIPDLSNVTTYKDWAEILKQMDSNSFIRNEHTKYVNKHVNDKYRDWKTLKEKIQDYANHGKKYINEQGTSAELNKGELRAIEYTEALFESYKERIKTMVDKAILNLLLLKM